MTDRATPENAAPAASLTGHLASGWAMLGFFALLGYAIIRLAEMTTEAWALPWTTGQWLIFLINLGFMAYSEGYKGFQCSYSPRFAARANYLIARGSSTQRLLAPLFCMGFFAAPRRRIIAACLLFLMIVVLVCIFRLLPQPWRGILDAGVVVGLSWGLIATANCYWTALMQPEKAVDAEVVS